MLKRLKITNSNLASYKKISIDSPGRHEKELLELKRELNAVRPINKKSLVGRILLQGKSKYGGSMKSNSESISIQAKERKSANFRIKKKKKRDASRNSSKGTIDKINS
tara:strand:+ start:145 stop:468 length:324 start_codon:yes stop_codon:yes gene_type:complete